MPLRYRVFIESLRKRTGIENDELAHQAAVAVLKSLSPLLQPNEAKMIRDALPPALATWVQGSRDPKIATVADICAETARVEGVPPSFGVEHAQAVCQCVGELLNDSAWAVLKQHLDEDIFALFERPRHHRPPKRAAPRRRSRSQARTLASARPGSDQPLSEAKVGPSGIIAQTRSIANDNNPR